MHPTNREILPIVRAGISTRDFPKNFNPADDGNWTVDNDTQRLYYRYDRLFLKTLAGLRDLAVADVRPLVTQEKYSSCVGRNKCVYGPNPYTVRWKPDYDYYLSLDDDIYLQPGQFLEMLDCAEENPGACVTALYRDANGPEGVEQYCLGDFFLGRPVCFSDKIIVEDVGHYEFAGLGAMLIPASVLYGIPFPVFRTGRFPVYRPDPEDPRMTKEYWFESQEDVEFSQMLLKLEIPLLLKGFAQHRDMLPGDAVLEYLKNH
jgi:hypothetical protein